MVVLPPGLGELAEASAFHGHQPEGLSLGSAGIWPPGSLKVPECLRSSEEAGDDIPQVVWGSYRQSCCRDPPGVCSLTVLQPLPLRSPRTPP